MAAVPSHVLPGERTRHLRSAEWRDYLAALGDGAPMVARIALGSLGCASAAGRAHGHRLLSISYDDRADEIEVHVGRPASETGLRYFIPEPRSIVVQESARALGVVVDDASGVRTVIELRPAATDVDIEPRGARDTDPLRSRGGRI